MDDAWGDSWGDAWGDSWSINSSALFGAWSDVIPCHLNQPRIDTYSDNPRIITQANTYRHDSRADQPRVTTEAD